MNILSDSETRVSELREQVQKFIADRDWNRYHDPENLAISIAIEASELMEVFQWSDEKELGALMTDTSVLEKVELELADVIIYCLSLANVAKLDVAQAVVKKIKRNESKYPVEEFKRIYKKQSAA